MGKIDISDVIRKAAPSFPGEMGNGTRISSDEIAVIAKSFAAAGKSGTAIGVTLGNGTVVRLSAAGRVSLEFLETCPVTLTGDGKPFRGPSDLLAEIAGKLFSPVLRSCFVLPCFIDHFVSVSEMRYVGPDDSRFLTSSPTMLAHRRGLPLVQWQVRASPAGQPRGLHARKPGAPRPWTKCSWRRSGRHWP